MASNMTFQLHCNYVSSTFTLTREGETWRRLCSSFKDAFGEAEARATEDTNLNLYNEKGEFVLNLSISPLAPELSRARRHWHELAGIAD